MNKTTLRILSFFVAHITESFTLREVARKLNMHVSLAHRAIKPLLDSDVIGLNKHKNLLLNYKDHHDALIIAEIIRKQDFFVKNPDFKQFSDEIINKINETEFILLVFGSSVEVDNPRDLDILLIVDDYKKIEFHEKFLDNILSNYDLPFDLRVICFESVNEMLSKRDEKNVFNELLNKHILLYGYELFFRLLKRGR